MDLSSRASASAACQASSEALCALVGRGADQHQHQRAFAAPRHGIEPPLAGERVAGARRDGEGLAGAVGPVERARARLDHEPLEPAGGRDRRQIGKAGPFEEGAVGIEQCVGAVDQHADRQALQDGDLIGVAFLRRRLAARKRARQRRGFFTRRRGLGRDGFGRNGFWRGGFRRDGALAQRLGDLAEGRMLDRRQRRALFGRRRAERHDVLRCRHHGEQRARLGRRRGSRRIRCLRHERFDAGHARDVAAEAEAAIAEELAIAIEDRQSRKLDRHALAGDVGRPRDRHAAPGVVRRNRCRDMAVRIERQRGGDLAPRPAEHVGGALAHRGGEVAAGDGEALVGIHRPHEAQRAVGFFLRLWRSFRLRGGRGIIGNRRGRRCIGRLRVLDVFGRRLGRIGQARDQHGGAAAAEPRQRERSDRALARRSAGRDCLALERVGAERRQASCRRRARRSHR